MKQSCMKQTRHTWRFWQAQPGLRGGPGRTARNLDSERDAVSRSAFMGLCCLAMKRSQMQWVAKDCAGGNIFSPKDMKRCRSVQGQLREQCVDLVDGVWLKLWKFGPTDCAGCPISRISACAVVARVVSHTLLTSSGTTQILVSVSSSDAGP